MRIAFIGDLQYGAAERDRVVRELSRVASLRPDFAVFMGDHAGQRLGSFAALRDLRELMEGLGCPYHAILGNHDVERYPSNYYDNAPIAEYREVFGRDPWRAKMLGGVLFVFVTVERQPREDMLTIHAVHASEWQFRWLEDRLRSHPGVPTVIVAHAPAPGSGVRRSMPLHGGAGDTYLDQSRNALRWRRLVREYPQIRAMFSAHLHMGHDYDSAIVQRMGHDYDPAIVQPMGHDYDQAIVQPMGHDRDPAISGRVGAAHVSCGVFIEYSRDGTHHTRFAEIDGDRLRILTFDHDRAHAALTEDAVIDLTGRSPAVGRVARIPDGEMLLGEDGVRWVRRICASAADGGAPYERYFVATDNGLLWEYDPALDEFCGALLLCGGCSALTFDGERLFVETDGGERFSVGADDRARFERIGAFTAQAKRAEISLRGEAAANVPFTTRASKEGLWVRIG